MQGANDYVFKGQAFAFAVEAQLGIYSGLTLTADNTIRLSVAGALQNVATDVVVEFTSDFVSRSGRLKIAGRSRMDRAHGYDIRDDCLRAAQAAGLNVNNSQADIDIFPADANVRLGYNIPNAGGGGDGGGNGDDPSGLPSPEVMFGIVVGIILISKFFRG